MSAAVQLVVADSSSQSLVRDAALLLIGGVVALTGKTLLWDRYFARVESMGDLIDSLKRFLSAACQTLNRTLDDLSRRFDHREASIKLFCQRHGLEIPDGFRELAGSVNAMVVRLERTYKFTFTILDAREQKCLLGELSFMYEDTRSNVKKFDVRVTVYSDQVYSALYPNEHLRQVARALQHSTDVDNRPVPMYTGANPSGYRR